ncbi:hypothetical protein EMIHUDRAFT_317534 [Emiliania huxleyi CCMP1516]|uniref:Uncharacterized protein n=2 Tax=Emiliania huxleyi TaxID=2903 RepID=A0A0D3KSE7_EMIH1|nr:hypothetical protein EMIHUDRAFT_317534 [Emiliania huxleyi CCMP1516]EOD38682.1 hypothetical protein EMIHUDRAFT_317534 [Emiliania huxleyi CCMP1516]|eukprot:XP_005791111.1 hypothetical protein EMIHUDRAFT_317534 [Emiliania huxleyi CCMP1516]
MTRGARGGTTGIALARARASPGPWPRARPSFWPASTAAAAAAAKTAAARRLHEHTIERPEGLGLSAVARPRHACARLRTRQSDSGTTLVGRRRSVLAGRRSVDRRPRHLLRRRPAPAPPAKELRSSRAPTEDKLLLSSATPSWRLGRELARARGAFRSGQQETGAPHSDARRRVPRARLDASAEEKRSAPKQWDAELEVRAGARAST